MALTRGKSFMDSQEGKDIKLAFQKMTLDSAYNTGPSYSSDSDKYPDNLMPFIDKHMNYLNSHPNLDPAMYLANIKLMSRIK